MHRVSPAALSTLISFLACAGLLAQPQKPSHCDPLVDVHSKGPAAYKERGDRCEGVYAQKVSGGTALRIVSLTDAGNEFKFGPGDALHLAWTTDGDAGVRLRAVSLVSRHYYRMDSLRPAGSSTWVWPADVLAQYVTDRKELGLLGVTRRAFRDGEQDVYLPIRMAKNAAPSTDKPYTLVVAPAAPVQGLYLSVSELKADGSIGDALERDTDVGARTYSANDVIRIALPSLPRRGYYRVELSGVTNTSKPISGGWTFYHAR